MPSNTVQQPNYPVVEMVLSSIADCVARYRSAISHGDELAQCSPDEVRQIAKDLGVSSDQLIELVRKGPDAAAQLKKMLVALKVDPQRIAKTDPLVMRDLQWLCVNCGEKKRCRHEIADGTAAGHFHEFCPNAMTLETLFDQKDQPAPQPAAH